MIRKFAMAALCATMPSAAEAQDDDGQVAFNNHCRTCHSTDEGDNRLGPSLHGILGREAGSLEGYEFSSALEGSDIVWDAKSLGSFIEDPGSVVSGNEMRPFGGISDEAVRASIVTFLENR